VVATLALPAALLLQGGTVAAQAAAGTRAPQVSARVSPESPAIGEPITVELRVRAPAGSEVRFPELPDSSEAVEPLDPRAMRDASTADWLDRTAVYRLIAWDTGARIVNFDAITVVARGVEQRYPVALPTLRVRSVLPADSTGRVPRPPRAPLEIPGGWWRLWVALAVILALGAWAWRAWRRRAAAAEPGPDAALVAAQGFAHARALGLLDAGEPGRHALTHVAVMREYLAARYPEARLSRTAREVSEALRGVEFPILPERVADLLLRAEPVAFAAAPIPPADAVAIAEEARRIVADVEAAWQARRASVSRRARRRG
jgi:hypothetical protein